MNKKIDNTIQPGVGEPLLSEGKLSSLDKEVLTDEELEIIMEGAEELIEIRSQEEGLDTSSEEELDSPVEENYTDETVSFVENDHLVVELQDGSVDIYDNVDRMAADGGDQLLHLYREGEQVAFYQIRNVLKASFSNESY